MTVLVKDVATCLLLASFTACLFQRVLQPVYFWLTSQAWKFVCQIMCFTKSLWIALRFACWVRVCWWFNQCCDKRQFSLALQLRARHTPAKLRGAGQLVGRWVRPYKFVKHHLASSCPWHFGSSEPKWSKEQIRYRESSSEVLSETLSEKLLLPPPPLNPSSHQLPGCGPTSGWTWGVCRVLESDNSLRLWQRLWDQELPKQYGGKPWRSGARK